jgi:Tfp pilus assembly protein PilX
MRDKRAMKKQAGIALFVCLMILLVLSLLGISAMRMMTSQNLISASSQGADIAFDAAETGINRAIYDAQVADAQLAGIGSSVTKTYAADNKGIATISVVISEPDEEISDDARRALVEMKADSGAFGQNSKAGDQIGLPHLVRFASTSRVDALDIGTTHVQDTMLLQ